MILFHYMVSFQLLIEHVSRNVIEVFDTLNVTFPTLTFSTTLEENFWEHRMTKWGLKIFSMLWFCSKLFIWMIFCTM